MLRIYGTVYDNADLAEKCLRSISKLKPYRLYVVDNYSTDKTYEILRRHKEVNIKRLKCSRGKGRDVALKMLLSEANPEDPVMYIDFDVIFEPGFIKILSKRIKQIKDNEMYNLFNGLSTAKTNRALPWRDLNSAEDWERLARAKSEGIRILTIRNDIKNIRKWVNNRENVGYKVSDRECRYVTNKLGLDIRVFKMLIDSERGRAHKSFHEFYEISANKNIKSYLLFLAAYVCGRTLGIYSYDDKRSNKEYVLDFKISSLWKF